MTSNIGLHVGVDRRMTDGNVITKICRIYGLPFFLTHGALLRARAPLLDFFPETFLFYKRVDKKSLISARQDLKLWPPKPTNGRSIH